LEKLAVTWIGIDSSLFSKLFNNPFYGWFCNATITLLMTLILPLYESNVLSKNWIRYQWW